MNVDIDQLKEIKKYLTKINRCHSKDITWYHRGEKVKFKEEDIKDFKFMGLNNVDIIDMFDFIEIGEENPELLEDTND